MFEYEKYTPFIWSAYGITAIVFALLFVWAIRSGPKL